jgi:hypothetical protein
MPGGGDRSAADMAPPTLADRETMMADLGPPSSPKKSPKSRLLSVILALPALMVLTVLAASAQADWKKHTVVQTNGKAPRIKLPAQIQIVTEQLNDITGCPYMVYMPEKDLVLMTFHKGVPDQAALMSSADKGANWSKPQWMRPDKDGNPTLGFQTGLSYLGNGKVLSHGGFISEDYGETWPGYLSIPTSVKDKPCYGWDPVLVERDETGKVTRMTATDWRRGDPGQVFSSIAAVFWSTDEGQTWSEPVEVPQWKGVNEVALARARNGDLVAACRTDPPDRFKSEIDHYCGLSTSISKDNGETWSPLNRVYEWGRHHPCMVVMPSGEIVMSYVVRLGYKRAADGLPQFGVEAVVSRDNGKTWDLDHKYILHAWKGNHTGPDEWWASSQATSTVLLPDGSLLTAYGIGYRGVPHPSGQYAPRDVGLVHWQLNEKGLNRDRTISRAPWDSDARNKFDLSEQPTKPVQKSAAEVNLATVEQGAKATCSDSDKDPIALLSDPYLTSSNLILRTTPAWIEIRWNEPKTISRVDILGGEPAQRSLPSGECAPIAYNIQYGTLGIWVDATAPARQEITDSSARDSRGGLVFTHKLPPVTTSAIRIYITKSNDTGKRISSPDKVIVAPDKLSTTIRGIGVYGE